MGDYVFKFGKKEHNRIVFKRGDHRLTIGQANLIQITQSGDTVIPTDPVIDRLGWLRIIDAVVDGGSVGNKVYLDAPNNTILSSALVSDGNFQLLVESSYPQIVVDGVTHILLKIVDTYRGFVPVSITGPMEVVVSSLDSDGNEAASDSVTIDLDSPPNITSLSFTGGYPGESPGTFNPNAQTELKAGDTFQITGTTDAPTDMIRVEDFGASDTIQDFAASGTSFTATIIIGDRGNTTQALAASVQARSPSTGAYGPARLTNEDGGTSDRVDTILLNNVRPTVTITGITYPAGQSALKASEEAMVTYTIQNFSSLNFTSPNGDVEIDFPTDLATPKIVRRIAGDYNVTVDNLQLEGVRIANGTSAVVTAVVNIANVAPLITVNTPNRIQAGGSETITLTSDQELLSAPLLENDLSASRGTFAGVWEGGPTIYTRVLSATGTDESGSFTYSNLIAIGLAGRITNIVTGDDTYEIGGFVAQSVTFDPFTNQATIPFAVTDFTKLQAGFLTGTNQQSVLQPIGTGPSVANGWTIDALGVNPTTIIWLDTPAVGANSGGTAQLLDIEEVA